MRKCDKFPWESVQFNFPFSASDKRTFPNYIVRKISAFSSNNKLSQSAITPHQATQIIS